MNTLISDIMPCVYSKGWCKRRAYCCDFSWPMLLYTSVYDYCNPIEVILTVFLSVCLSVSKYDHNDFFLSAVWELRCVMSDAYFIDLNSIGLPEVEECPHSRRNARTVAFGSIIRDSLACKMNVWDKEIQIDVGQTLRQYEIGRFLIDLKSNQINLLPYELQVSHFTNKHNAVYNMRLK